MKLHFTIEASGEAVDAISIINEYKEQVRDFFENRTYSADMETLYICLFCMSPQFEPFFQPRKPKYTLVKKEYTYKGVFLTKGPKTYEYELRLDYQKYSSGENIMYKLANDIIESVDHIAKSKKIKKLDLEGMKKDLADLFHSIGWI